MSMATAMVSPIALPKPRMVEAMMPGAAVGRITPRMVSHRVAPRAYAPSRRVGGTATSDEREMAVMVGRTIRASTMLAVSRLFP